MTSYIHTKFNPGGYVSAIKTLVLVNSDHGHQNTTGKKS